MIMGRATGILSIPFRILLTQLILPLLLGKSFQFLLGFYGITGTP